MSVERQPARGRGPRRRRPAPTDRARSRRRRTGRCGREDDRHRRPPSGRGRTLGLHDPRHGAARQTDRCARRRVGCRARWVRPDRSGSGPRSCRSGWPRAAVRAGGDPRIGCAGCVDRDGTHLGQGGAIDAFDRGEAGDDPRRVAARGDVTATARRDPCRGGLRLREAAGGRVEPADLTDAGVVEEDVAAGTVLSPSGLPEPAAPCSVSGSARTVSNPNSHNVGVDRRAGPRARTRLCARRLVVVPAERPQASVRPTPITIPSGTTARHRMRPLKTDRGRPLRASLGVARPARSAPRRDRSPRSRRGRRSSWRRTLKQAPRRHGTRPRVRAWVRVRASGAGGRAGATMPAWEAKAASLGSRHTRSTSTRSARTPTLATSSTRNGKPSRT